MLESSLHKVLNWPEIRCQLWCMVEIEFVVSSVLISTLVSSIQVSYLVLELVLIFFANSPTVMVLTHYRESGPLYCGTMVDIFCKLFSFTALEITLLNNLEKQKCRNKRALQLMCCLSLFIYYILTNTIKYCRE